LLCAWRLENITALSAQSKKERQNLSALCAFAVSHNGESKQ